MSGEQQAPLSIVEYYQTLPHWRKHLCHWLEQRARQTGLDLGVCLSNAVSHVSYPAGYWLSKTLHRVGYNAGYWLSIVFSGYPWNTYRMSRSQQDAGELERGVTVSKEQIEAAVPPMSDEQQRQTEVTVVHELNLGEHTLIIMSDNSIDLMDLSGEPWSYLAHNGLHLTSDEAYHLYISLHEVYKTFA